MRGPGTGQIEQASPTANNTRLGYALISPVVLVGACALLQMLAGRFIGVWAWIPTMLIFWTAIAFLTRRFSRATGAGGRFMPVLGNGVWPVLAVLTGLLSLPGFINHSSLHWRSGGGVASTGFDCLATRSRQRAADVLYPTVGSYRFSRTSAASPNRLASMCPTMDQSKLPVR